MAELVDAHVSGACAERREGSSPFLGTKIASDCFVKRNCCANESRSQVYLDYAECSLTMPSKSGIVVQVRAETKLA